jgi:hypothetical protein
MNGEKDLGRIAPCGLSCWTCVTHSDGIVGELSRRLAAYLEGFETLAETFSKFVPAYKEYAAFSAVLGALGASSCAGCRSGKRMMTDCPIATCAEARGLTYCSECTDFPCDAADPMGETFRAKWERNIARLRDLGPEVYLAEINETSHYV